MHLVRHPCLDQLHDMEEIERVHNLSDLLPAAAVHDEKCWGFVDQKNGCLKVLFLCNL